MHQTNTPTRLLNLKLKHELTFINFPRPFANDVMLRTVQIVTVFCVITGFRRRVDENCALLGHYAASIGNLFQGQLIGPILKVEESKRKPLDPLRSLYREGCGR
jgi:hypothetical protein